MLLFWIAAILILLIGIAIITATAAYELIVKPGIDYFSVFLMGLTWLAISIIFALDSFYILGILFTVIGLSKKHEWKQNYRNWKKYTKEEKPLKIIVMSGLIAMAVLSVAVYFITISFLA
ncbi:hypothetical protein GOV08_03230 [Candidatus Woesearchaeota archaeon]|nr:hypothetical protein [Candidatus Woesearchaeota archaeon]